ncbi:hypothetical protein CGC21_30335 [Leishmania donovani]|uniref:PH domain-containing protein n=1 Tax=Leishmania donovani TaxID=5661 RepID=A0A504XI73_LEIDO|nr:hypothetical protein CGC21_30335 [Leishmania donovani]
MDSLHEAHLSRILEARRRRGVLGTFHEPVAAPPSREDANGVMSPPLPTPFKRRGSSTGTQTAGSPRMSAAAQTVPALAAPTSTPPFAHSSPGASTAPSDRRQSVPRGRSAAADMPLLTSPNPKAALNGGLRFQSPGRVPSLAYSTPNSASRRRTDPWRSPAPASAASGWFSRSRERARLTEPLPPPLYIPRSHSVPRKPLWPERPPIKAPWDWQTSFPHAHPLSVAPTGMNTWQAAATITAALLVTDRDTIADTALSRAAMITTTTKPRSGEQIHDGARGRAGTRMVRSTERDALRGETYAPPVVYMGSATGASPPSPSSQGGSSRQSRSTSAALPPQRSPRLSRPPARVERKPTLGLPDAHSTMDLRTSVETLRAGDWFYKWTSKGDSVHRRWFWIDTKSYLLVWSNYETYNPHFCGSVRLDDICQVTSRDLSSVDEDGFPKTYYVLLIETRKRVLQLATELKDKCDTWFEALNNVMGFIHRNDMARGALIPD